ncbi:MAG: nucleotide sugar dehydrogenase [Chloroflexi bacterium]|nr:nucleotide sugar dehydrogenase [Chloroflexota bacterium]
MLHQRVCVVGLGYVGLTLAVTLADRGFEVFGVEINPETVALINRKDQPFHEPGLTAALHRHLGRGFTASTQMPTAPQDAFIICVGTPWDKGKGQPVLDHVTRATRQVAEVYRPDSLVVLRSTVPPGTSRSVVLPILQEHAERVLLAFCPERTAEGVALRELRALPQIIGGLDPESTDRAQEIFRRVTHTTIEVSSLEVAETIKLVDNSYRDTTFAFANEVALLAEALGLDGQEIIRSANMGYPRTSIPIPGYVGGACLAKDPHILAYAGQVRGFTPPLVTAGRALNESLPDRTVAKLGAILGRMGKDLSAAKVLVAGLAFKGTPETNDLRESPSLDVARLLQRRGARVYGHDFVVTPEAIRQAGLLSATLEEGFKSADAVLFTNNHKSYSSIDLVHLASLLNRPAVILDGWNLFEPEAVQGLEGVYYAATGRG